MAFLGQRRYTVAESLAGVHGPVGGMVTLDWSRDSIYDLDDAGDLFGDAAAAPGPALRHLWSRPGADCWDARTFCALAWSTPRRGVGGRTMSILSWERRHKISSYSAASGVCCRLQR